LLAVARRCAFEATVIFVLIGVAAPLVLRLTVVRLATVLGTSAIGTLIGEAISVLFNRMIPETPWKYCVVILALIMASAIFTIITTRNAEANA